MVQDESIHTDMHSVEHLDKSPAREARKQDLELGTEIISAALDRR
jgi:hypothetical protein